MTSRTPNPTSSGQDELREQISRSLVKWHMPTRQIAIDEIMDAIAHHTQGAVEAAVLTALRQDRKANTEFWKEKVNRMFDAEIAVYEATLASTNQPKLNQGEADASSKS